MNVKKIAIFAILFMATTQVYPCISSNAADSTDPKAASCQQNAVTIDQQPQEKRLTDTTKLQTLDQDSDFTVQKFEELVQEALDAQTPSKARRRSVFAVRELVKFAPIILLILSMACNIIKINPKAGRYLESKYLTAENAKTISYILTCSMFFTPVIADHFIHCKDRALAALKNIEKYVKSLSPDQKKQIAQIFKEKYAHLQNKMSLDDFYVSEGLFDLGLDAIAAKILFVDVLLKIKTVKDAGFALAFAASLTADLIVNYRNLAAYSDPLYRINQAFIEAN
ncbi:MAG: hypothetical protein US49_C0002G0065 [candidate division TM6 bacterium GW2011_GWF2_37_49]|nr:MAG: hypothetical protein US49_C0002G0065 [candidate division TM6 bacterium GW2011_GWF2_37_49]